MIDTIYLLKYSDLYNSTTSDPLDYIIDTSLEDLYKFISLKHNNTLNYNNFFSDKKVQSNINNNVRKLYSKLRSDRIEILSDLGFLILIELILSNKDKFTSKNKDKDLFEISIFKSILAVNEQIDAKENIGVNQIVKSDSDINRIANFLILNQFVVADTEINRSNNDLLKYIYTTLVKFQKLFYFINIHLPEFIPHLINQFKFKNEVDFIKKVKDFLMILFIEIKLKAGNEIIVEKEDDIVFFNSLISEKVEIVEDFQKIKENPILKISNNRYTYFDFLFIVDRFYKGIKFNFKHYFEQDPTNKKRFGDFFSFYNLEFSEKFIFRTILDEIFQKKYFKKLSKSKEEIDNEPDYYLRYNNDIFLFESKDILINKSIKASHDLNAFKSELNKKLFVHDGKPVGIGQLISHIEKIITKSFEFDDYKDKMNHDNLKIYPIIVLHERIFDISALNYLLNDWFIDAVQGKLGGSYNSRKIKSLILIDIDTLISFKEHLKLKDRNFRDLLDLHLSEMNKKLSSFRSEEEKNKKIHRKLMPISYRIDVNISSEILKEFEHLN